LAARGKIEISPERSCAVSKKLNHLLLLILMVSGLTKPSLSQAAAYVINLNFGKAKPLETVILNQMVPAVFAAEKLDGIQIEVTESLSGTTVKQKIPDSRIRLLLDGRPFQLATSTFAIDFDHQIKTADSINLGLELKLNPKDHSDLYTGTILLKTWANRNGKKKWQKAFKIKLTVEVQPWIKIQADPKQVTLDQVNYTGFRLANLQPLRIRIAANTDWVLGCNLDAADCGLRPTVRIQSGQTGLQILNTTLAVTAKRQNLAVGAAAHWREILLGIEINDFHKYPSSEYTIPLRFTALVWDRKTAIP
jgi:hypothetical protein